MKRILRAGCALLAAALMWACCAAALADGETYTDEGTGMTFVVPDGWTWERDGSSVTLSLQRSVGDDKAIRFESADYFDTLTPAESAVLSRSELNNDLFSEQEIADMFGVGLDRVSHSTFGGRDYYSVELEMTGDYGTTLTVLSMFRIVDARMYLFQFSGTESDPYYADFVAVLESVRFPGDAPAAAAAPAETSALTPVETGPYAGWREDEVPIATRSKSHLVKPRNVIVCTLAGALFPLGTALLIRYALRRKPSAPKKARLIALLIGIVYFLLIGFYAIGFHATVVPVLAVIGCSFAACAILKKGWQGDAQAVLPAEAHGNDLGGYTGQAGAPVVPSSGAARAASAESAHFTAEDLPEKDPVYCPVCGLEQADGSSFCRRCGARIL